MKRNDELSWCVRAGTTNLFVEDAARLCGAAITDLFADWVVVCEHQESIHQHNVVAVCRMGDSLL
jgi:GTP cyclohydrolase FolE2